MLTSSVHVKETFYVLLSDPPLSSLFPSSYVKLLANLGCLVVLAGRQPETPGKRAPPMSTRTPSDVSPLEAW